jgi:hypothetical protein
MSSPDLPLVGEECRCRAEQTRLVASRFVDPTAKQGMLQAAAAYESLATLKRSLEYDLELTVKSREMIDAARLEIKRNWRWVG